MNGYVLNYGRAKFAFLADAVFDVLDVPVTSVRTAVAIVEKRQDHFVPEGIYWREELIGILDLSGLCEG